MPEAAVKGLRSAYTKEYERSAAPPAQSMNTRSDIFLFESSSVLMSVIVFILFSFDFEGKSRRMMLQKK